MSWCFITSTTSWCWYCQNLAKKNPKNKCFYSIRIRDKPSGLPLHSLDQMYPMSQEQQLHGSSTSSSSAPGLGLHLGAASNQGWLGTAATLPAWASVPIRSYFKGITGKLGCHLVHMPCLCCWIFQTFTRQWIRIFGLLPTKFFKCISWECGYICWGLWYRFGKKCQRTLKD